MRVHKLRTITPPELTSDSRNTYALLDYVQDDERTDDLKLTPSLLSMLERIEQHGGTPYARCHYLEVRAAS